MAARIHTGRKKPVLVDSSSAIILFKSGSFEQFSDYYRVIIPPSVYSEVTREGYAGSNEFIKYHDQCRFYVYAGSGPGDIGESYKPEMKGLGAGEKDTILLYYYGTGDMIVLDDGRGAAYCKNHGIPYINALLVPRILCMAGLIIQEERDRMMKRIIECGRYSQKIIEYARFCDDGKLAFAMA